MTTPKSKRKPGRPKVAIDWQLVGRYAESGASGNGIAAVIGIDERTLRVRCQLDQKIRLSEFLQLKKAKGDEHLRDKQYEVAMTGDKVMLIWLGKQRLDQADKKEIAHSNADISILTEQLIRELKDAGHSEDQIRAAINKIVPQPIDGIH